MAPTNIVIVAEPGNATLVVRNRDTNEVIVERDDFETLSERTQAARDLHDITGWPIVKHP